MGTFLQAALSLALSLEFWNRSFTVWHTFTVSTAHIVWLANYVCLLKTISVTGPLFADSSAPEQILEEILRAIWEEWIRSLCEIGGGYLGNIWGTLEMLRESSRPSSSSLTRRQVMSSL